jgi:hypothetical protein
MCEAFFRFFILRNPCAGHDKLPLTSWQSFQSNGLDHKFVATPYLLDLVGLSVKLHVKARFCGRHLQW